MPMILRSRKSLHRSGEDDEESETEERTTNAKRTSSRLAEKPTYAEFDDSDSDTVYTEGMEREQTDENMEDTDDKEVKQCCVVLDRLSGRRELEERDDMSRKSVKLASRIPTFHKRPAAPSVDPSVSRKELADKPASSDSLKSKLSDVREKTPMLARPLNLGSEAHNIISGAEQTPLGAAPRSSALSEEAQPSLMVSPRPALRAEESFQGQNKNPTGSDRASSLFSRVDPLSYNSPREETPQIETKRIIPLPTPKQLTCILDERHAEAIADEKPPWESDDPNVAEPKELRSLSDVDSEEEQQALDDSGSGKDDHEAQTSQEDFAKDEAGIDDQSANPVGAEQPAKAPSTAATKESRCGGFALYFLLSVTLLLAGMHAWRFGLPTSIDQLAAHLELHWLEGTGPITEQCSTDCRAYLVESIPAGLYPSSPSPHQSTAASWLMLLDKANSSVSIAAFYMSLRSNSSEFADFIDAQGRKVFEELKQLPSKNVKLNIAINGPQNLTQDTSELTAAGANIREVNLSSISGGIVHTKLLVVDQKHFYLGSANMDWRSLSQVKEVGMVVEDCSCLAQDATRIWEMYWSLKGSLPPYWPARTTALSSAQHPLRVTLNGVAAQVYLSSAPPQISARGRSDDLATILSVIGDAQEYVFISVMDYLPLSEFTNPIRFWPAIDSALRAAACVGHVKIRILVSCWEHSPAAMFTFLQSLLVLNKPPMKCDIEVKIFTVPSTVEQMRIPYARVNHAKYMVTDRVLYIGTSNWSENYFTETAGVGLVVNQTQAEVKQGQRTLRSQAEELFQRDWRSHYASSLSTADIRACPRLPL